MEFRAHLRRRLPVFTFVKNYVAKCPLHCLAALVLAMLSSCPVWAQMTVVPIIKTIGGNGTFGYSGDNGPATSASIGAIQAMAVDRAGNVYIADSAKSVVRKIDTAGKITTVAGTGSGGYSGDNGPATSADLNSPLGVAVDAAGNLYIADSANSRVRKVDTSGTITTIAGTGTSGTSGDNGPATSAKLGIPAGLAFDRAGNLYIADAFYNRLRKVDTGGTITTFAGSGPSGYTGDNGPATSATLTFPFGIAVSPNGDVYIADAYNLVIRKVDAGGTITTVAGYGTAGYSIDGTTATSARLNYPYSVAVDTDGNVYIAETGNADVRVVSASGILATVAGIGEAAGAGADNIAAAASKLNAPHAIAFDGVGNLYIADPGNYLIREVSTNTFFPALSLGPDTATQNILLRTTAATNIRSITAPTSLGGGLEYTVGTVTGCTVDPSGATATPAGTTCTVPVTFKPAYPGDRPVALQVNTTTGTYNFGLHGTGVAPQTVFPTNSARTQVEGTFQAVSGVAVDSAGNLVVADSLGNTVKMFNGACNTSACATLGGGFSAPAGVAIDAAGNVYVADSGNNAVKMVPPGCISSACVTTLGGGFSVPSGVAVDLAGNVFVADAGHQAVKEIPVGCTSSACVFSLGGTITGLHGIEVDAAGNVYATDSSSASIKKIPYGCASAACMVDLVPGLLGGPTDIAVDPSGALFVTDSTTTGVALVPSGCTSGGCGVLLSDYYGVPATIARDAQGNMYMGDGSNLYKLAYGSAPSLHFLSTAVNTTSSDSPKSVLVENAGNADLVFPIPGTGNNPSLSAHFVRDGSSTCPQLSSSSITAGTLTVGATCTELLGFSPTTTGNITGGLVMTTNSLNGSSSQTISLSGNSVASHAYFVISGLDTIVSYSNNGGYTLKAYNADGTINTSYNSTPVLTATDPGRLAICSAFVNGVSNCSFGMKIAGTQTITATDPVDSAMTGSLDLTVLPGALTGLRVSAPASAVAGTPISVTVTGRDLYGNTVTTYTGPVHLTSDDPAAVLPSNTYLTAGSGTLSVTLKTPGTHTITATDVAISSLTGTTGNIAVATPLLVVTTATDGAADLSHCTAQAAAGTGTDSACSLRDALAFASAAGGADISFDTTKFAAASAINLSNGTLTLPGNTSVQGATTGSGATLKNLVTLYGGFPLTNFTILKSTGTGSSIANLVLTRSNGSNGGAIMNSGTLTVKQCTIVFNTAANGGGIYNTGTLTLDSSTVSGNSAIVGGAGIYNSGTLTVLSSTISGNAALGSVLAFGGGIQSSATLVIEQSTISNNIAAANSLGGIAQGAGIYLASGTLALSNSIVAANTFASAGISADISGNYTDGGGNQASNNPAPISTLSLLKLSALGNYGGPVQTIVPLPGSPALCTGKATNIPVGVTTDQRGYPRTSTYGSTTCVDAGSTQTSYALAFAQQPSDVVQNAAMSPAPTVKLTENGVAFSPAITIPLTLSGTGTLSGGSAATSSGTATYSSLKVDTAGTGDKLKATLTLSSSPSLSISATSDSFDVATAVTKLVFGTAPATPVALGGNAGASVTVKEADTSGVTVASAADTITLSVTGPNSYSKSYTATAVSGVATFDLSSVALNNAGDYTYKASLGSTSTTATQTVNKGTATVTLGNLSATYDGNAHAATATTVPSGLTVSFTYEGAATAPTAAGSYAVVATVSDANYQGSQTGTLVIGKATATVTLGNLSATYDGNSHAATATTVPSGLTVAFTYDGASTVPTAAGSYAVVATVNDANYQGSQTGTLVVGKITPVITWSAPTAITYGTALSSTQLNAAANTTGSFAYTPAAGTVLSAGANQTLSVDFTPTDATNYSPASKSVSLTVNKQATTLALSASATAISPLQTVTFTATAAPVSNGTPTGTVTFYDGTTALQTVTLTGSTASYTTGLPSGTHTISATYDGDANYLTATAASSVGVTVAPLDFTLTQQGANYQTVVPGGMAEFNYLISPTYGTYPGTVTLSVTGLPPGATYTLSQNSVSATGGAQQFTLSIKTATSTAMNHASRTPWTLAFLLLPLAGATRMRKKSRKLAQSLLLAIVALAGIASLTGCGSSNGFLAHASQDYNVTVTATAGTVVHTSTVTLNVQ